MSSTTHRLGKSAPPVEPGSVAVPAGIHGAAAPDADAAHASSPRRGFEVQWRDPRRTLVDYVGGLWAYKVWIVLGTVLATSAAFFFALTRPNTYASSAVLMVYGSTSAPSPAAAAANLVQAGHLGTSRVLSAVEIIRSRPVARAVVDAVGPAEVQPPYQPIRLAEKETLGLVERVIDKMHDLQMAWFSAQDETPEYAPGEVPPHVRELAAVELLENLYVYPDERASTIRLVYYSSSPESAQRVLDTIVRESVHTYGDVFAPPSARTWLETKYTEARTELADVRAALAAFVASHGATDFADRITHQRQQIAALDAALDRAKLDLERNKRVITLATEARDRTPRTVERPVPTADGGRDLYLDFLRQKLIELRLEERRETATMGQGAPASRVVTEARELMKVVEAEIDTRLKEPPVATAVAENPRWAILDETISRRQIENIDLGQTIELYPQSHAEATKELQRLEALQQEALQLQERLAKADQEVEELGARISAFEITNELDRQGLTSLRPVEPATLPLAKQGPARGKLVAGGFGAGLLLGITLVLARVRLSRTFLRSSEAAFSLGRADVVGVPRLTRGNLRRFAQARRMGWD